MQIVRVVGKLEPGGAQLALLRVSRELSARHGIRTRLLVGDATPDGLHLARSHGVAVDAFHLAARLHPTRNLQWRCSMPFARWLAPRLVGADVVHAHMVGAWWAAAQVIDERTPFVATEHNQVNWTAARIRSLRPAAARVDRFYAMGPAAARFAHEAGVDPAVVRPARSAVDGLDHVGVDAALPTPRITFAGRFAVDKGIDVLVHALTLLPESVQPAAHLLGDGPLRDEVIVRLARLPRYARFVVPGWVAEPWRSVAGSSVHVVPSREEAWSQSAVLAMGLGVPVVGTRVDGLAGTLAQGRGILVPPDDPHAIADAIVGVLEARLHTDLVGARAYARGFTPERVAVDHLREYEGLVQTAHRHIPAARNLVGARAANG